MTDKLNIAISVLDDDPIIIEFIADIFKNDDNYQITYFTDPDKFMSGFSKEVDLVITDIRISGYDVISTIKTISIINPTCYIVVMSGYLDVTLLLELIKCRVDGVIEKTSNIGWLKELKETVDSLKPKLISKLNLR